VKSYGGNVKWMDALALPSRIENTSIFGLRIFAFFFRIFEGTTPLILLSDPELLRNVLIKDSHVFSNRRVIPNIFFLLYIRDSLSQLLEGVLGPLEHGLTALKDEAWKNARSIVSPTFSSAKLKSVNVYTSNYSL
jgi:cytochrome P450